MRKYILWFGIVIIGLVLFGVINLAEGVAIFVCITILLGTVLLQRDRSITRDFRRANEYIKKIKKLPTTEYDKKAFSNCKKLISQIVKQANTDKAFNRKSEQLLKTLLKDLQIILVNANVGLR